MKKSTLLHLRIPFSFFLLPVFCFAWSISEASWQTSLLIFFVLHFLLYPASNGYNSYFDKDEGSIGGLKQPPKVSRELYVASLLLDLAALGLGMLIGWEFTLMLLIYGLISKAYSHPSIRLKKYPFTSWFVAGFFQGCFTFGMVWWGLNKPDAVSALLNIEVLFPALLSSLLLWAAYPMTQVYQHEEDARRGDQTLSLKLGIRGTFYFTAVFFLLAAVTYSIYFSQYFHWSRSLLFLAFLLPVIFYFLFWFMKVYKDDQAADFEHTMKLNMFSALCMNIFFIMLYFLK
jgi:4-hydroxybenzoate polyprenyltransferase